MKGLRSDLLFADCLADRVEFSPAIQVQALHLRRHVARNIGGGVIGVPLAIWLGDLQPASPLLVGQCTPDLPGAQTSFLALRKVGRAGRQHPEFPRQRFRGIDVAAPDGCFQLQLEAGDVGWIVATIRRGGE